MDQAIDINLTHKRKRHTNSKFGCATCKQKRVRCDETLPQCQNCRKKNVLCSYLNLTKQEISRIRLAHSIRENQRAMIGDVAPPSTRKELKFEVGPFSETQTTPTTNITPPDSSEIENQFVHTTIQDFSRFYTVVGDCPLRRGTTRTRAFPFATPISPATPVNCSVGKPLPNGRIHETSFRIISKKNAAAIKTAFTIERGLDDSIVSQKGRAGFYTLLYDFFDLGIGSKMVFYALISFGSTYLESQFKNIQQYDPLREIDLKRLNHITLSHHGNALQQSRKGILNITDELTHREALMSSAMLLGWINLVNGDSISAYIGLSKGMVAIFSHAYEHKQSSIFTFLKFGLVYSMKSVFVPEYDPTFIYETVNNLLQLAHDYNNSTSKLKFYYNALMDYLENELLPALQTKRSSSVINYHSTVLYQLLYKWYHIFPSDAFVRTENSDLAKVLHLYFHSITRCLDAIFPDARYLFTVRFIGPTHTFPILASYLQCGNKRLQRHIYYSVRLLAFFYRRYSFVTNLIFMKHPYSNNIKRNRLKSRKLVRFSEQCITSFNGTLLRPEHYPTRIPNEEITLDELNMSQETVYTRTDPNMESHSKNIEELDFFNMDYLQFNSNGLLIQDYDPIFYADGDFVPDNILQSVDYDTLGEYYYDIAYIIDHF